LYEYLWFKLTCYHITQELTETTSINFALQIPVSCHPHPSYMMLQPRRLLQSEAKRSVLYTVIVALSIVYTLSVLLQTLLLIILLMTHAIHLGCITKIIFIQIIEHKNKGRCCVWNMIRDRMK